MIEKTRYAFVVLNWNGKKDTEACLNSLDNIEYEHPFDIIIVDNGSADGSLPYLKKVAKILTRKVKFVLLEKNTGFTGGHIKGLEYTDADMICLLNNDAVVAQNILQEADTLIKNLGPRFGAIGGRAYFWNSKQKAFDIWNRFFTYQKIDPVTAAAYTIEGDVHESLAPRIVDNVSGACVFVNRKAIEEAGYLDDTFFAYYEETDLFARFKRLDYEIYYCPTLRYWHRFDPESGSHGASSKHLKNFSTTLITRNQFYFAVKNFEPRYLFRFFVWYYVRFLTAPIRLMNPSRKNIELIIIKTTVSNFFKLPSLLKKRKQIEARIKTDIKYNTKIIQQAQSKTVVFLETPQKETLNYILNNISANNRVHLRSTEKCNERFNHRCVRLHADSHINAIAAASSRTEFTIIIKSPSVSLGEIRKEIGRVSRGIPFKKNTSSLLSFNKAYIEQVSITKYPLNKSTNWEQRARNHRIRRVINKLSRKPRNLLTTLVNYLMYRFRQGGISDLSRSVFGLIKNSLLKPKATLMIVRAGAHEQRMHVQRTLKKKLESNEKISFVPIGEIPVFINCRDRVATLQKTISAIERTGLKNIFLIDNQSSYGKLLDYYEKTKYQVILLGENMGHKAPWESGAVRLISAGNPYILTDPDVVLSEHYTESTITKMLEILDEHPGYVKIGPALSIDDIPDSYEHKKTVQKWEKQFWNTEIKTSTGLIAYDAEIDTTFAIYRQNMPYITLPSIRIGEPYTAKHLPWYQDSSALNEEEEYYKQHASSSVNTWNKDTLPDYLKQYSE